MSQLFCNINGVGKNLLKVLLIPFKKGVQIGVNIDAGAGGLLLAGLTGGKQLQDLPENFSEPSAVILLDRGRQILFENIDIKILSQAVMDVLVTIKDQRA